MNTDNNLTGKCRCGCNGKADFRVYSHSVMDGGDFIEDCCYSAAEYLRDGAAEEGSPYRRERLP